MVGQATRMAAQPRKFDVVIFGATGFTGSLACEHLARRLVSDEKLSPSKFAIAARSSEKVESLKQRLSQEVSPCFSSVASLVGDASDEDFLKDMCSSTSCVLSYVGPYLKYGLPLARACVEHECDYCDITGEATFQLELLKLHDEAKRKGVKLVTSCGYDSVPFDLASLQLVRNLRKRAGPSGGGTVCVQACTGPSKGGVSGGTIDSAGSFVGVSLDNRCLDPLSGEADGVGPSPRPFSSRQYHPPSGTFLAPSVMEPVNAKVVYRTRGLLPDLFGDFVFQQFTSTKTRLGAWALTAAMGVIEALLGSASVRNFLIARGVLPKPGEGPSKELRDTGYMNEYVYGDLGGLSAVVHVKGRGGDPGYKLTSAMSLQTALCLAAGEGAGLGGGVLTPASCLGEALAEKLEACGVTFELHEDVSSVQVFGASSSIDAAGAGVQTEKAKANVV